MEYYHNLITEKSFKTLQDFKRLYKFILIGGWAIFLYTKALKSKDIDVVIEYDELEKLKKNLPLFKNERLKKYEIKTEEIDIDLYLPFFSNPGIPAEEIKKYTQGVEGFVVPRPEILLILKQRAFFERIGSPKGEKDKIDIISLLNFGLDFKFYNKILRKYNIEKCLGELKNLLQSVTQIQELKLNQFKYSKLKKKTLAQL